MFRLFCTSLLLLVLAVPYVFAAEPAEAEGETPAEDAEPVVEEKPMTQAELAVAIVRMLGLENELPPGATELDYIDFLRGRGVQPLPTWNPHEEVTKEVLAVVVVQVLGLLSEVADKENVNDYVTVLEEHDLILTSVRDVLSEIEVINPLVQIIRGTSLDGYEDNLSSIRGR